MDATSTTQLDSKSQESPQEGPSSCPVAHIATASPGGECPFPHGAGSIDRSPADVVMRRLMRISDTAVASGDSKSAYSAFSKSMMISAIRCTLTYVVFPLVLPALSFANSFGPVIGIIIGVFAMGCDLFTIRRFFVADHKWRWPVAIIAGSVICLLAVLLVQDIIALFS